MIRVVLPELLLKWCAKGSHRKKDLQDIFVSRDILTIELPSLCPKLYMFIGSSRHGKMILHRQDTRKMSRARSKVTRVDVLRWGTKTCSVAEDHISKG